LLRRRRRGGRRSAWPPEAHRRPHRDEVRSGRAQDDADVVAIKQLKGENMINAAVAAHGRAGLWAQNGGYEYPLVLAVVAAGLAITGPGRVSVDAALGLELAGLGWGLGAVAVGVVAAVGALSTRRHTLTAQAQA
jgi:hypothetical protein